MTAKRMTSAMRKAQALAARPNVAPIDLAEALWHAAHQAEGGLRDIAAACGVGSRKAYYLHAIWSRFADLGVARDTLAAIGWTKLALIARHAAPGGERAALELAADVTAKELHAILRGAPRDRPKAHSILLRLSPSQHKVVVATLTQFGAAAPKRGKGLAGKERALIKAFRALRGDEVAARHA